MRASIGVLVGLAALGAGCQCTDKVKATDGVLRLEPNSLDFGALAVDAVSEKTVTFHNDGAFGLDGLVDAPPAAPFELIGLTSFHLNPGESTERSVRFHSGVTGAFAASIAGSTTSRTSPAWSLPMSAVVLPAGFDGGRTDAGGGASLDGGKVVDSGVPGPDSGTAVLDAGQPDAACSSSTAFAFASAVSFDGGNLTRQVVTGDFNRDGQTDVALALSPGITAGIDVMLATGLGTFGPRVTYSPALTVVAAKAGDFNRDGILDLVLATNFAQGQCAVG